MIMGIAMVAAMFLGQGDDRPAPLKYLDPGKRFVLNLPGNWLKNDPPEFPCQAMYLEITQGAFVSLHVRKVPAATELKAAVSQDAARWSSQKQWKLASEEAKTEAGVNLLVQKAGFLLVDPESPEDAEPVAIRLVHAVFADAHVTVGIVGEEESGAVLDAITQRVLKGLRPPDPSASAGSGHDEGKFVGEPQAEPAAKPITIDPAQLAKLDADARAAIMRLLEQQNKTDRVDVDERDPPATPTPAGATSMDPFPASFTMPKNWRIGQRATDVLVLVSDTEPGMIFVHAGLYSSFDGMYLDLNKGFAQQGLTGQAVEGPKSESIANLPGTFAAYQGQAQDGTPLAARFRAVLSPKSVGIMVCGITTPQMMPAQAPHVDAIARSFQVGEFVPDREAMATLVGEWAISKGSSSGSLSSATGGTSHSSFSSYSFRADGTYSYAFESSLSVTGGATSSGTQANVSSASNDHDDGRFFIAKQKLVLASSKGTCATYELKRQGNLLEIGGATYRR